MEMIVRFHGYQECRPPGVEERNTFGVERISGDVNITRHSLSARNQIPESEFRRSSSVVQNYGFFMMALFVYMYTDRLDTRMRAGRIIIPINTLICT
jgi:hypothetical protein